MNRWVDVGIGDWFYNHILEASNLKLADGSYWIAGMTYNVFEDGKPYLYHETTAGASQVSYQLPVAVNPTPDNPLSVFVDGVQVLYKSCEGTTVTLYVAPKEGSIVSFVSWGKPVVDDYGRPTSNTTTVLYPQVTLSHPYQYFPYMNKTQEYVVVFGKKLRRLDFPYQQGVDVHTQLLKYMGYSNDYYWISPAGVLYVPLIFNRVSCTVTYWNSYEGKRVTETVNPSSATVLLNNRFFPQAKLFRCEFFALMNQLRRYLYDRFTDYKAPKGVDQTFLTYLGQNVFRLNGYFAQSALAVYVDGVHVTTGFTIDKPNHMVVFDKPFDKDVEVRFYYNKVSSTRFGDVNNEWWAVHVLELEDEMVDGEYIINEINSGLFNPTAYIFRKDAVAAMNRFRKWCLERFV